MLLQRRQRGVAMLMHVSSRTRALTTSLPSPGTAVVLQACARTSLPSCMLGAETLPQPNYPEVFTHCCWRDAPFLVAAFQDRHEALWSLESIPQQNFSFPFSLHSPSCSDPTTSLHHPEMFLHPDQSPAVAKLAEQLISELRQLMRPGNTEA